LSIYVNRLLTPPPIKRTAAHPAYLGAEAIPKGDLPLSRLRIERASFDCRAEPASGEIQDVPIFFSSFGGRSFASSAWP